MKWKVIGEFIGGLAIGGVCALVFGFFILNMHFDMFGEIAVTRPEQRDRAILIESLLFVAIGTGVAFMLRKSAMHFFAAGFWLVFLFVSILPIVIASRYFVKSNYRQPFSREEWLDKHPLKMSREIERTRMIIGKSRQEVVQLLGEGDSVSWATDGVGFEYDAGDWNYAFLYVKYKNNKVEIAQVGCYCD